MIVFTLLTIAAVIGRACCVHYNVTFLQTPLLIISIVLGVIAGAFTLKKLISK